MSPHDPPLHGLAARALSTLRTYFDTTGHHPSGPHWHALAAIAGTMEDMAGGLCPPKVFLSAVDPGVGKSQTVIHFGRALMSSPAHPDVGMIVCVGRIKEAVDLANELAGGKQHVAVLTSDAGANALGNVDTQASQVLITTQQRIELATKGRTFAAGEAFHFRGSPRVVRVWDEAWLPGAAVTVSRYDLLEVLKPISRISPDLADAINEFADTLKVTPDGGAIAVPDFTSNFNGALFEVLSILNKGGVRCGDQMRTATGLVTMSAKVARVCRDGGKLGQTMLTYRDTLPDDLLPLLVLDASGRVRQTYADIEEHRGTLNRLPTAVKNYGPLTIHLWKTSGSKSGFSSNGPELVKGILATIAARPDEKWLVVAHKAGWRVANVETAIRRGLPQSTQANVKVITWGNHMASNDYADVPTVILAGTLFMPPAHYVALTHLAQDRPVSPGLASGDEIANTVRGEHANLILQALCRGRVRKSNGADCHPMNAYVIASGRSGIPRELVSIFPGCTVKPWTTTEPELTGKLKEAVDYAEDAHRKGIARLTYRGIQGAIKVQSGNFRKQVTGQPEWTARLERLGWETFGGAMRATGIRLKGTGAVA